MNSDGFDYDVLIIGSGFGGSVAALRAAEKGYRVGMLESGRRWNDEDVPKSSWDVRKFAWLPAPRCTASSASSSSTTSLCCAAPASAGVRTTTRRRCTCRRSSSSMRRNGRTSPTGPTSWRLIDQAPRMLGAVPYPVHGHGRRPGDAARSQPTWERGNTYSKAPVGVYFGTPGSRGR